jgi:predicted DNA-binding transcriptional regulator YafY
VAGVALLLQPEPVAGALAEIAVLANAGAATTLDNAALEGLRQAIPALRALPLLQTLAQAQETVRTVTLDYLPPMQLRVAVRPC